MADKRKPLMRSEMMARIRSKDTRPELILRRGLHAAGFRFRVHVSDLPGKPDIVLPKFRSVIFVHGCFWHGHADCKSFRVPKTRTDFWMAKIKTNRDRDDQATNDIRNAGWRVLVVWECATRSISVDDLIQLVAVWLQGTETSAELNASGLARPGELTPRGPVKQEIRI